MSSTRNSNKLFVYGSLMFEAVRQQLLERTHQTLPATLQGYQRLCVRGQPYPGLRPQPDAQVEGLLLDNLSASEIRQLDRFEGGEYQRSTVTVQGADGVGHPCEVYITRPEQRHRLSAQDWDHERFEARELKNFLRHCIDG